MRIPQTQPHDGPRANARYALDKMAMGLPSPDRRSVAGTSRSMKSQVTALTTTSQVPSMALAGTGNRASAETARVARAVRVGSRCESTGGAMGLSLP